MVGSRQATCDIRHAACDMSVQAAKSKREKVSLRL